MFLWSICDLKDIPVVIVLFLFFYYKGAIGILSAKTKLLDPRQLEQIEGRVQALGSRLNQLTEKKEAVVDADKDSKVMLTI